MCVKVCIHVPHDTEKELENNELSSFNDKRMAFKKYLFSNELLKVFNDELWICSF